MVPLLNPLILKEVVLPASTHVLAGEITNSLAVGVAASGTTKVRLI